jgi:hypothetical protein
MLVFGLNPYIGLLANMTEMYCEFSQSFRANAEQDL